MRGTHGLQVGPLVGAAVSDGYYVVYLGGRFAADDALTMGTQVRSADAPPLAVVAARGRAGSGVWLAVVVCVVSAVTAVRGPAGAGTYYAGFKRSCRHTNKNGAPFLKGIARRW